MLALFLAVGALFALYRWCKKSPSSSSGGSSSRNDRMSSRVPTGGGVTVHPASHSNGGGGAVAGEGNAKNGTMSNVATSGHTNGGYEMGNMNDSLGRNDTGPLINAANGNGDGHSNGNGLAHVGEPIYQTLP